MIWVLSPIFENLHLPLSGSKMTFATQGQFGFEGAAKA